ncbi:MAG: hypothetical protein HOV77_30730 [Hamadaea sp.]|uniref:DUF6114 domain-containing protein n=1 Tax=Hamadaea sp. TaxID=2024425 RepID=UPI0017DF8044|nr:DUF6114 domain-containing protein [Hamadaea sp.]NUT23564.1 hypothetical protein [Hamadaea sp.]
MEFTPPERTPAAEELFKTADRAEKPNFWEKYRTWRRARPYWGGLLAILAGIEVYASTQTSIGDIVLKVGVEGFQAYLIPLMLILAGFLAWFTPAQRAFYGIITAFISVYALIGVNFGGWILGTLLGMTAGALIFSWTPNDPSPVLYSGEPRSDDDSDTAADGSDSADGSDPADADDEHNPRHAAYDDTTEHAATGEHTATGRAGEPDLGEPDPARGRFDGAARGKLLAISMVPLLIGTIGVVAVKSSTAAYGAPCPTVSRSTTRSPKPSASTSPAAPSPTASASPSAKPSPSESPSTNVLGQIVGGLIDLLTPDSPSPTPSESSTAPKAAATTGAPSSPKPTATKPTSRRTSTPCGQSPSPSASTVPPAKRLTAAAGQVDVTGKPGLLTGSKVTMVNLAFQGIVDLPTADGTIQVLKFTMDSSVTDDFNLHTYARGKSPAVDFVTDQLTVRQNVVFYTSRFQAKLFGLLPVDYSPTHPPDIPIPPLIPIIFTDPQIDLVWVNSDVLTAKPQLVTKPV